MHIIPSIRKLFTKWCFLIIGNFSKSAKKHLELFDFQNLNWSKKFHPRSKTFTKTTFSGNSSFTLKIVRGYGTFFLDHPVFPSEFHNAVKAVHDTIIGNYQEFPWIRFETCLTFKGLQKNDSFIIMDPVTSPSTDFACSSYALAQQFSLLIGWWA